MTTPKTISQLVDAFGGQAAFGRVIGTIPSTASEMKRTGAIRVKYWPLIIAAAAKRRIKGVTPESLMRMHTEGGIS